MTEPTEPPTEPPSEPESPSQPPAEPPSLPSPEPEPPAPPETTDVRTTELLERRERRSAAAEEAKEATSRHAARAAVLRGQVAADMGPELAARYEDLARISDAMAQAAQRVLRYQRARVVDLDTELEHLDGNPGR